MIATGVRGRLPVRRAGKFAGVVQLVEHLLAKQKVVGSRPIARSSSFSIQRTRRIFNICAIFWQFYLRLEILIGAFLKESNDLT